MKVLFVKGSSNEKLYQELGLESYQNRLDGSENVASFTKLLKNTAQIIYLIYSFK